MTPFFNLVERYKPMARQSWNYLVMHRGKFVLISAATAAALYGWSGYNKRLEQKRLANHFNSYENQEALRYANGENDEPVAFSKEGRFTASETKRRNAAAAAAKEPSISLSLDDSVSASPQVKKVFSAQNIIIERYAKVCECQKALAAFETCQKPLTAYSLSNLVNVPDNFLYTTYQKLLEHDEKSQNLLGVCRQKLSVLEEIKDINSQIDKISKVTKNCEPSSTIKTAVNQFISFKQGEGALQKLQSVQDYSSSLELSQQNLRSARKVDEFVKEHCVALEKVEREPRIRSVSSAN